MTNVLPEPVIEDGEEAVDVTGSSHAPDGSICWPATPDRDSPQIGEFEGRYKPEPAIGTLLKMEGEAGRSDAEVERITGTKLRRPRRWHKLFERMGIFYPGAGSTRLARLGRILRDAAEPNGLKVLIAREVLAVLLRYQFDNPIERALPEGDSIHPYYAILRAASLLDWKIHWDEVNRELMRCRHDDELDAVVARIRTARSDPGYDGFIGKPSNEGGPLRARTHPAGDSAPTGKTPEGQLRDQQMTPFLKRAGFGELLLSSPGAGGGGYWTVPDELREMIAAATASPPEAKKFGTEQEWIQWFCEGSATTTITIPPPAPPTVRVPVHDLTLSVLKAAIQKYDPDLVFPDALLASVVAALRSGDGRNFIILRGISGTGKTRLVSAIAKAVYGVSIVDRPFLTVIEVRPDWTDGSPLLGHYDPIGRKYIRQPFLDALITADASLEHDPTPVPIFICLDEMNLARVEYYLADCLSAMESGNALSFDIRDDGSAPARLHWPSNIYLFGTVNIDESTLRISDKVLDRAQVIDTSEIQLAAELGKWLAEANALDNNERDRVSSIIIATWSVLKEVNAQFGFRAAKAIVRFVNEAKASSEGTLSVDEAINNQLSQKVLVKFRGDGEQWRNALNKLEELFGVLGGSGTAKAAVIRMRDDLERLGSFQFWT